MTLTPILPVAVATRVKAKLFRGLADNSRLAVLECLLDEPRCVTEIVATTGLSQPNVSNHLACLKDCGLVEREQRGRFVFYRLSSDEIAQLLVGAERVLNVIGDLVDDCPQYEDHRRRR